MNKKNRIYLIDGTLDHLDMIVDDIPEIYGAYIDHRRKRDMIIFVKPEYRSITIDYIKKRNHIRSVMPEISDNWY